MLFQLPHWSLVKDSLWHDGKSPIVSIVYIYIIFQLQKARFLNHQPFFNDSRGTVFCETWTWPEKNAGSLLQPISSKLGWIVCPKVGGTFEVCEYEGFPEILQNAKMPRDTSPHQLMHLLSPLSKSHEMLGDRGDTQIPTKMFGFFWTKLRASGRNQPESADQKWSLSMTSLVLQASDKSSQKQTCNERPLLIYEMI